MYFGHYRAHNKVLSIKMKAFVLIVMITTAFGSQNNIPESNTLSKGLVKTYIMDSSDKGMFFDTDYYKKEHMRMVSELYGDHMKKYEIDSGISGRTFEDKVPYLAVRHLYFDNLSGYNAGFGANKEKILRNIPKYINIRSIVQISDVVK